MTSIDANERAVRWALAWRVRYLYRRTQPSIKCAFSPKMLGSPS
ncbi:Uncharacterised protein [Bordetella pertussis]|nr:Uncharacterised protein [Bordetella pertussis]